VTLAAPPRLRNQFGGIHEIADRNQTTGYAAQSLVIEIAQDEGQFLATLAELPLFGEGDTPHEAAVDLLRSLLELREQLASKGDRLSPDLVRQFTVLNRLVR
jgi:hypothetical protein